MSELHDDDLCDVGVYDVEQNIRSAAPVAHDPVNGSTTAPAVAADRQQLSAAAMFSSKLTMTPDQYEQFIRLQQLLMHMQTTRLLQPSDSSEQVRNVIAYLQYPQISKYDVCIFYRVT